MHRFYISPENWNHDALALTGSEAHHARDVLRMKRGEKLVLFNGRGREITAEILDLSGDEIRLRRLHEAKTPPVRCRIILGQAIPKGKKMESIVHRSRLRQPSNAGKTGCRACTCRENSRTFSML
ncbi:MAG: hypothetical protein DME69_08970 [Verrucomicrobia bacterium]|nr:MAG: hypothetical protein DME69_08970 [Verrucomicrobiota bacterium]